MTENKIERYKGSEGSQYENEEGTIIKQVVCLNQDFAGLMLERFSLDGKKINEFVADYNPASNEIKHYSFKSEYQRLQSEIEDNGNLSDDEKIKQKARLLRCFCNAYSDNYRKKNEKYLSDVYDFIDSFKAQSIVEMFKKYMLIFAFSVLVILLLISLDPERTTYYQAAIQGELGSFVMLCFSYNKIKVINREPDEELQWRYGSKLICGTVFGFIMILILKANLILPDIASNEYVQLVCCFFAGFNSKWVPKIGESITGENET